MTFEEKVREHHEAQVRAAWGKILNDPLGRIAVWSILEKCHIFQTTYTGNADTNFLEGERSVGLKMLQEHIFPLGAEYLAQMMEENAARIAEIEMAIEQEASEDD